MEGLNAASRFYHQRKKYPHDELDRFIPNRSAIDFDHAHFMLTGGKVEKDKPSRFSPFDGAYRRQLADIFGMNRTRILAFRNKQPRSVDSFPESPSTAIAPKPAKSG